MKLIVFIVIVTQGYNETEPLLLSLSVNECLMKDKNKMSYEKKKNTLFNKAPTLIQNHVLSLFACENSTAVLHCFALFFFSFTLKCGFLLPWTKVDPVRLCQHSPKTF